MKLDDILKRLLAKEPIPDLDELFTYQYYTHDDLKLRLVMWNEFVIFDHLSNKRYDIYEENLNEPAFLMDDVLVHKDTMYLVHDASVLTLDVRDLKDKDYLFNLSLVLSTELYHTILIGISILESNSGYSFVLFTKTINMYLGNNK